MKKHFSCFLEILWLIVSILSLFAGIHKTYYYNLKDSYIFYIFTLIGLFMYLYRRNLRKNKKDNTK